MRIKVKKTLPVKVHGPIVFMVKHGKAHIFSKVPGEEFEVEEIIGNKLLGEYSEVLEVLSYGPSKNKMVESMETK